MAKKPNIAILRSMSAADQDDRQFGNTIRAQLEGKAKQRNIDIDTKLIDFDQIFRNGILHSYNLEGKSQKVILRTLRYALAMTLRDYFQNSNDNIRKEFLQHYNNAKDSKDYLQVIYEKDILPQLSSLRKKMVDMGKYKNDVASAGLSQIADYSDSQVRDRLINQEEIAILGSLLMGKYRKPNLYGKIKDNRITNKMQGYITGAVQAETEGITYLYTHGNDRNIAPPGRPLNAARDMVESALVNVVLKRKIPMLAVCGGIQKFLFEQGGILQRMGVHTGHAGDIYSEDEIITVTNDKSKGGKPDIIFHDSAWGENHITASDNVFSMVKNVGFKVNTRNKKGGKKIRSVELNCQHSQAVILNDKVQEAIFKLDPRAIIIKSDLDCDNKEYVNISKGQDGTLVSGKPLAGKVSVIEAVIMPSRKILAMQSHPDGFRSATIGSKVQFDNRQIQDAGIDTDKHRSEYVVQPNLNTEILNKMVLGDNLMSLGEKMGNTRSRRI